MKTPASLLIFLCATAAFVVAGDVKTKLITGGSSFTTDVPDHFHLRIFNFTQEDGSTRGVVIASAATPTPVPTATPTPTPTPTPIGTDLTATKTDNVGGRTVSPTPWTWKIHVANGGSVSGSFLSTQTIMSDNLPNSNITYGPVMVGNFVNITNSGNISCSISGSDDLTCTASGATVMIGAAGSFDVSFSATAATPGSYANPRTSGVCLVDPDGAVMEANESNNSCLDTVVSSTPTPTPTPTPPPRAVLTATLVNPASPPEFIKQVVVDGAAQITVTCPDPMATCVITYQKEPEATPTPTP
jgi:hypothetical protein